MKQIYLFLILSGMSATMFSQMEIHNPLTWDQCDVNIENLKINVNLVGAFAEVEYIYEIAASNPYAFDTDAQLEYVHHFFLPANTVFNDSWLWIDDYISKGVIYDKGEGTAIYESIVERRQDPSILTKLDKHSYSFRVYPLFADSTRKVKISYLVPMDVSGSDFSLPIILDIFYGSAEMERLDLNVTYGEDWEMRPLNNTNIVEENIGATSNLYNFEDKSQWNNLQLDFTRSSEKKNYLGVFRSGDENYYQLAFYPELDLPEVEKRYNMFAVDFYSDYAAISKNQMLDELKNTLLALDDEKDFFNLSYNDFGANLVFDKYMEANEENILKAISDLDSAQSSFGSSLLSVYTRALNFLVDVNEDGNLVVFSSDVENGYKARAEEIIDATKNKLDELDVNLIVLDMSNDWLNSNYIDGIYYEGNDYLYLQLVESIGGSFFEFNQVYGTSALVNSMAQGTEITDLFSFNLGIENGFTFEEYVVNGELSLYVDEPIIMVGKYIGDVPDEMSLHAVIDGELVIQDLEVESEDYTDGGPLLEKIWGSQFILENEFQSDLSIRKEVIEFSKKERLLSFPTVFLCLELDSIGLLLQEEQATVAVEEYEDLPIDILATPNPFVDRLVIKIDLSGFSGDQDLSVDIVNIHGAVIAQDIEGFYKDGQWIYEHDALDLEPGIYIVRVRSGRFMKTLKVIKVK